MGTSGSFSVWSTLIYVLAFIAGYSSFLEYLSRRQWMVWGDDLAVSVAFSYMYTIWMG